MSPAIQFLRIKSSEFITSLYRGKQYLKASNHMYRFYLPEHDITKGAAYTLSPEESRHLVKVLRLGPGAWVRVFNGNGKEWVAEHAGNQQNLAKVIIREEVEPRAPELPNRVVLAVPLTDQQKLEFLAEKATELGVSVLYFFQSSRTRSHIPVESLNDNKIRRLRKKTIAAAKQCGRAVLPELHPAIELPSFFDGYAEKSRCIKILPLETCKVPLLSAVLDNLGEKEGTEFIVAVGPEGGFAEDEADRAAAAGFIRCSLGSRILRLETAVLCTLSHILAAQSQM